MKGCRRRTEWGRGYPVVIKLVIGLVVVLVRIEDRHQYFGEGGVLFGQVEVFKHQVAALLQYLVGEGEDFVAPGSTDGYLK